MTDLRVGHFYYRKGVVNVSFNKIPVIGNEHSEGTRNIINLMVQVINNRGIEILSESAFLTWLEENGVKHQGEWDDEKEYDRLSVVLHEGNSYTSKKRVPAGIDILNKDFWVVTGNYNSQVENYRQETIQYKNDTDDVIIQLQDDLDKKIGDVFVNPVNFGLSDMLDDNSVSFNNALDSMSDTGGTLVLPQNRVYKFNKPLNINEKSNIKIDLNGSTLDFSSMNDGTTHTLIEVKGKYLDERPVTVTAIENDKTVNVNTSGLSAGDWVKIKSSDVWDKDRTSSVIGEINQVDYIENGTKLVLKKPLQSNYNLSKNPTLAKVDMVKNIVIENGYIDGGELNNNFMGIFVELGYNINIRNMHSRNIDTRHIVLSDCIFSTVINSNISESNHLNQAYGVSVADASSDIIISNNHFTTVRHSMSTNNHNNTGGIARRVIFSNNTVNDSTINLTNGGGGDAVDTHSGSEDIIITDNIINSSSGYGINFEARSGLIKGNYIKNASGGIHFNPWADFKSNIIINDNVIRNISTYGIAVIIRTADIEGVTITGNNVDSANNTVRVQTLNDRNLETFTLSGNTLRNLVNNTNISMEGLKNYSITGNSIMAQSVGMMLKDSANGVISGNSITTTSDTYSSLWGVRLDNTVKTLVNSNQFKNINIVDSGSVHGLSTTSGSHNNGVSNNMIDNFTVPVYLHSSASGNVESNNISI